MDLLEHQGKELFARAGIPVPAGRVVTSPDEAAEAAEVLGGRVAIKAQVRTGGRGKAGGVKVVSGGPDARAAAGTILGMTIGSEVVERLLIEPAATIEAEYYTAITFDRRSGGALFLLSARGGVEVEAGGEASMAGARIDPLLGLADFQVRALVFGAGIDPRARGGALALLPKLYRVFAESDATLVEVNPLALTPGGLVALDAKVTIDDSALFRHPDLAAYQGDRPDRQEALAAEAGLNFVKLDGDVGIIGNGAGLVMSTLDVVAQAGGAPANFLDVGGGASAEQLARALGVVLAGPPGAVHAVLVNIFGGITRCDLVARGILEALARTPTEVPIVIRLEGTNAAEGRAILAEANHPRIRTAAGMMEAAAGAVQAARERAAA
ncbi:MAG TPA: ADP-forming succinate--CoA ligase subunit beta [Actinomycetota bacterium]|nr:ADP-forming succinate--CoA ligase subunit beta [Actinomycetota bacterium]